jgi:hypothetical protein
VDILSLTETENRISMHAFNLSRQIKGFFFFYRFLFTNNARMTSLVGDKFVAGLIGTLCDALESEYGMFVPRLYRIFKPLKGNFTCCFTVITI